MTPQSIQRADGRKARKKTTGEDNPPPIVTPEENEAGHALQQQYRTLENYLLSLTHIELGNAWKMAADAFIADPNEETLASMKRAALERSFFRADNRARVACKHALKAFTELHVIPWATEIITRNLAMAAEALAKVRAVENSRCIKLTGHPLQHSDIVAAAERPVNQLQMLLDQITLTAGSLNYQRSPAKFLAAFAAVGLTFRASSRQNFHRKR